MNTLPRRNRERLAGALFLFVFVLYGGGVALLNAPLETPDLFARLVAAALSGTEFPTQSALGGALAAANSVAVVVIAAALYPVLVARSVPVAVGYLAARIGESVLLASGVACLLTILPAGAHLAENAGAQNAAAFGALSFTLQALNGWLYQFAMLALGAGSVGFCLVLLRAGLIPKFLAFAGIAGYAALAVGAALELFGVKAGVILAAPGGVFELVFGVWLLWKGFAEETPQAD